MMFALGPDPIKLDKVITRVRITMAEVAVDAYTNAIIKIELPPAPI